MTDKPIVSKGHLVAVECLTDLRDEFAEALQSAWAGGGDEISDWSDQLSAWLREYAACIDAYSAAYEHLGDVAQQTDDREAKDLKAACQQMRTAGNRLVELHRNITSSRLNRHYDRGRVLLGAEVRRMLEDMIKAINKYYKVVHHPEQFEAGEQVTLRLNLELGRDFEDFRLWLVKVKAELDYSELKRQASRTQARESFFAGALLGALGFSLLDD